MDQESIVAAARTQETKEKRARSEPATDGPRCRQRLYVEGFCYCLFICCFGSSFLNI
jgi:hypothetical protein